MAACTPGQGERCRHAASKKCTCRCEGANHGKAVLTPEQEAYADKLQAGPDSERICIVCGRPIEGEVWIPDTRVLDARGPIHVACREAYD